MAIVVGTLAGLAYALPPGPITAETVRQGSRRGFRAALAVQAGAMVADVIYALLASLGLATVFARPLPHALLIIAGTLIFLALGASSLRAGWRGAELLTSAPVHERAGTSAATSHTFLAGLGLSFVNPYSGLFWLSLDSAVIPTSQPAAGPTFVAFFLAVAGWGVVLACGASSCRFLHTARVIRLTSILCGLMYFASGLSLGPAGVLTGLF